MKKLTLFFLAAFSFCSFAVELHCPEKIETKQSLVKPMGQWKENVDTELPQWYERYQVYSGPPSERASLIPEGPEGQEFWTNDEKQRLWFECIYSHSAVTLQMEIPKNVKKCVAKMKSNSKYFLSCQ